MFNITLPSSYEKANFLSKLTFCWIWRFFLVNRNKPLTAEALEKCPRYDQSDKLCQRVESAWNKELRKQVKGGNPNFFCAISKIFVWWHLFLGILLTAMQGVQILQSLFLGWLVASLSSLSTAEDQGAVRTRIYYYAAGIIITQVVYVLGMNPYFFYAARVGMDMRIASCSLIYRKALRLSSGAFATTTVGQIVNLLSNDVNRFDLCMIYPFWALVAPLQTLVVVFILWPRFGPSCLYGIAILLFYIPLQGVMGKMFSRFREKAAKLTDERVRLMNEFIPAMRVIKMYTWEKPFAKLVDQARRKEVRKIRESALLRAVNLGLFYVSAKVILFVIFVVHVFQGGILTAELVFVSMALINQLRLSVTLFFPYAISSGAEALISMKRIKAFLLLPEQQESEFIRKTAFISRSAETEVVFKDVYASWTKLKMNQEATLKNLNFSVNPGMLTAVVGPVGSGKSSLLLSILGEIPIISGFATIKGRISYASQEPWTFAGTVRDNIVYGSLFNAAKYNKVVHVCALERDMTLFPDGDRTVVGDRGVSLSGGQRARINLARCLYHDADIYLLDDPLSAVDASVAKHIFEKCVQEYLRKKVVILVTHQLQFIKAANQILLLKNGAVFYKGTYADLLRQKVDVVKFSGIEITDEAKHDAPKPRIVRQSSVSSEVLGPEHWGSTLSLSQSIHVEEDEAAPATKQVSFEQATTAMPQETISTAASARAYWIYIKRGAGWILIPFLLISIVMTQVLYTGSDWWLSLWTNSEEANYKYNCTASVKCNRTDLTIVDNYTPNENIVIYAIQMVALFALSLMRTVCFFLMCMRASVKLHDALFRSVVRAPIAFFDKNPIGVILNRCSRDMGIVDDQLPPTAFDAIGILSGDVGIAILVAYIDYRVLLPSFILIVIFYFIRKLYVGVARDVKRLEGVTRSPVFSHLSTSLYGLSTIRAFNSQARFEKRFDIHQDCHTAAWFAYISTSRWFIVLLDWICVAYIASITIAMVLNMDNLNGSSVGLAISSAIMFSGGFQWGIRQLTEVETQMTSIERIDEYSSLKPEGELEAPPERRPPYNWPDKGEISFCDVWLHYDGEHAVLKNLNFTIKAKEKVGVVGRTGAGKSSLITALFRLTEPSGSIVIDNIDSKAIGLHDLRRKIAIIPQEPILFSGTIRKNLDPFEEVSDQRLWQVLEQVQLDKPIRNISEGLDGAISDGGGNFSVGQRQLICLARAILRNNRILVLDEATANVDPRTDSLIQETIRDVFADCTIITIAHRLHTIMDSDKVLVMDAGVVAEFGEPLSLLENKNGLFHSMLQATGKETSENLKKIAQLAYEARRDKSGLTKLQLANAKAAVKEKTDHYHEMNAVIETEDEGGTAVSRL